MVMCLLVHYVGAGSNPAEPNLFFLRALATATQRRRPRFQRTAFHPKLVPIAQIRRFPCAAVCRSFRETHFYYDRIRLFFFFVRAYARSAAWRRWMRANRVETRHLSSRVCLVTSSHDSTHRVTLLPRVTVVTSPRFPARCPLYHPRF